MRNYSEIGALKGVENNQDNSVHVMVGVGIDKEFIEALNYSWADTEMSCNAIRTGQPCIGRYILTDPAFATPAYAPLREDAVKSGFAAVTAFPLLSDGEILGTLVIAAVEPDAFGEKEVKLLRELADDLAYGIANLRIRAKQRVAEATITRLAYYDPLTELPNRTLLLERVQDAIHTAKQNHHALALLHLHMGRFREINQILGYRSGDQLLQQLAQRMTPALKENDVLARVGESDFALLLPKGGADYAIQVAQQLIKVLHDPVEVAGLMVDPCTSIGIALYPGHATEADTLLWRANVATQDASSSRDSFALYTGGQEQECTRRLSLMGELRQAIEKNQLMLYCQPKVDIDSRRVCGAEALVRWKHPVHGMLASMDFMKLAEHAGLITPLTHWMLGAAFSQSYIWHEAGLERPLSVNLSAHDLYHPLLIDRIKGLFSTWGIRPELIQFELTESALMKHPARALETLTKLKKFGIRLFIDDFGTGYSSLSYLHRFPFDALKIDRSFVARMTKDRESLGIVKTISTLADELEKVVIAEGVETAEQWRLLNNFGCKYGQGFYFSKPVDAELAGKLFANRSSASDQGPSALPAEAS